MSARWVSSRSFFTLWFFGLTSLADANITSDPPGQGPPQSNVPDGEYTGTVTRRTNEEDQWVYTLLTEQGLTLIITLPDESVGEADKEALDEAARPGSSPSTITIGHG